MHINIIPISISEAIGKFARRHLDIRINLRTCNNKNVLGSIPSDTLIGAGRTYTTTMQCALHTGNSLHPIIMQAPPLSIPGIILT